MSNLEKFLFILCFLGSLYPLSRFLNIDYFEYDSTFSSSSESLGQVYEITNDTRYKELKEIAWNNLSQQKSIHAGEMIFTGEDSRIKIKLTNGSEFILGENSIVSLGQTSEGIDLELKHGSIESKISSNTYITVGGKIISTSKNNKGELTEISISRFSNIDIEVKKGSIDLRTIENQKVKRFTRVKETKDILNTLTDKLFIKDSLNESRPIISEQKSFNSTKSFLTKEISINSFKNIKKEMNSSKRIEIAYVLSKEPTTHDSLVVTKNLDDIKKFAKIKNLQGSYYIKSMKKDTVIGIKNVHYTFIDTSIDDFTNEEFQFNFVKRLDSNHSCSVTKRTNRKQKIEVQTPTKKTKIISVASQRFKIPCTKGVNILKFAEKNKSKVSKLHVSEFLLPSPLSIMVPRPQIKGKTLKPIELIIKNYSKEEYTYARIHIYQGKKKVDSINLTNSSIQFVPSSFSKYTFKIEALDNKNRFRKGNQASIEFVRIYELKAPVLHKERIVI